ncbi:hypothetical protein B0H10DRAFT_2190112 [Mycena sp. CBHHK59/15]|nr:hypothetical protein B0H10DRAFT_2190112 [Mycena sp. CBHHK59/15]
MFFSYALTAAALIHVAASAAVVLPRVTPSSGDCIHYGKYIGVHDNTGAGSYFQGCADVVLQCLSQNSTSIWSNAACVAGATCQGTTGVITLAQCQNNNVVAAGSIPKLDPNVYAKIVGDCAFDKGGPCPITKQNYIDFVFGQMSAAGTTIWPTDDEAVAQWWNPIVAWTATGDTIPFTNFNDWLHWSNS